MGKVAYSGSASWSVAVSRIIGDGSISIFSSGLDAAVDVDDLNGTVMIFTEFPSTDSVAEIESSLACIFKCSPWSVTM